MAAPTTSLPERLGGVRNWDYRICWVRDATFALYALVLGGYLDEARAWRQWLLRALAGTPEQVQVMYGLAGERRLTEIELPWLPGYAGSAPVRIGNAAHAQFQLDVWGEVLDAAHAAERHGLERDPEALARDHQADGASRVGVDGARRGHLGGARAAPALHPLQGDGVGRRRPHGQADRGGRRRRARSVARARRGHPRRRVPPRLRSRPQRLRAGLRRARAGREPAHDPAGGLPARRTTRACAARWPRSSAS